MSTVTQLQSLGTILGTEIKNIREATGDLSQLTVDQKSNLVAAINELLAVMNGELSALIDDTAASVESVYSSTKINDVLNSAITGLVDGAPVAYDTLLEIADWISTDVAQAAAIEADIANRLPYHEEIVLAEVEKANTHETLDLGDYSIITGYYLAPIDPPDIDPRWSPSVVNANGTYQDIGFMGVFRHGEFTVLTPGEHLFVIPSMIRKIRVRVLGRGGVTTNQRYAGGGGGYAHGMFDVTPGEEFIVKVPALANVYTQAEFGNVNRGILVRATNGGGTFGALWGGQGFGGDFQSNGGNGASHGGDTSIYSGGGASGSQVSLAGGNGSGGSGLTARHGGSGGVRGNGSASPANGQPGYSGGAGGAATSSTHGPGVTYNPANLPGGFPRFPLDGLYGAGNSGQPGAGASFNSNPGVGGGSCNRNTVGGGTSAGFTSEGLVIIEW